MKLFYQNNYKFFMQRNLQQDHPYLTPGRIPVAKLVSNLNEQEILNQLSTRQFVKSVSLQ
jgi:hypothetical protein